TGAAHDDGLALVGLREQRARRGERRVVQGDHAVLEVAPIAHSAEGLDVEPLGERRLARRVAWQDREVTVLVARADDKLLADRSRCLINAYEFALVFIQRLAVVRHDEARLALTEAALRRWDCVASGKDENRVIG